MTISEDPAIAPVSPVDTNEVVSNGGDEPAGKQVFSEGPCAHQAKKKLIDNKKVRDALKKEKSSKKIACVECSRTKSDSAATAIVESAPTSVCLTCGYRLCEPHAIAHSKAPRSGDDHPFYYNEDEKSVRCFACEVIVDIEQAQSIKMLLNELKSLWKMKEGKGKEEKTGDKAAAADEKPQVLDRPEPKAEKKSQMTHSSLNGTSSEEGGGKRNGLKSRKEDSEGPQPQPPSSSCSESNGYANGYANGTGGGERPKNGLGLVERSTAIPAKGLPNLGNTCFFNSVMQCMLHTHELAFYLERFGRVSRLNFLRPPKPIVVNDEKVEIEDATLAIRDAPTPLNDALRTFVLEFRAGRSPPPSPLFNAISHKAARFRSMAQQDAHELLRYLLDGLCSEETARYQEAIAGLLKVPLKTSKEKPDPELARKAKAYLQQAGRPLLDAVFGGRLLQTIRCSKCHHVSERYENMYDLSVPLTGGSSGRTAPRRAATFETPSSSTETPPGGGNAAGAATRPSKHQQKKEAREAKRAKKGSRTLKTQTPNNNSKTGEETIEAKMEVLRLQRRKSSCEASEEDEGEEVEEGKEADEKTETGKTDKDSREEVKEGGKEEAKAEEPCSSGCEEEEAQQLQHEQQHNGGGASSWSYRSEERAVDPLDLTKVLTTMKTSLPTGQSIAASLLEFTAEERLEGANAYECEKCCTPVNKKKDATGAAKTRVEATKRYLIVTPPVVLTIHVKRFQQMHMGMKVTTRKVSGNIQFPLVFDIAPFCCKNVERIAPGQSSLLYSLYGVVSHSGNLGGGHYVAYVKSRERIPQTEEMLETARAVCADAHAEPARAPTPAPAHASPEEAAKDVPKGQWYYCSDSRVSAISESKVLNEEAYLLFYERIY